MLATRIVAFAILLAPVIAKASYLEFCELHGTVASQPRPSAAPRHAITVSLRVESVRERRDRETGMRGYADCSEHIGTIVEFDLPRPTFQRKSSVQAGDRLAVLRSIYDGGLSTGVIIKLIRHEPARRDAP
jgi:hypothetical protein